MGYFDNNDGCLQVGCSWIFLLILILSLLGEILYK